MGGERVRWCYFGAGWGGFEQKCTRGTIVGVKRTKIFFKKYYYKLCIHFKILRNTIEK